MTPNDLPRGYEPPRERRWTLEEIVAAEPRVAELLVDVGAMPAQTFEEGLFQTINMIERRLEPFVGWFAANPALRTQQAYDEARRAIMRTIEARIKAG